MTRLSPQTLRALELVRGGMSQPQAAKQCGIARSTLWRALQGSFCKTCGHRISEQK